MKQNQKKRFNNGRFNNRNQRQLITRNTVMESSGPCGKLRGTALQLFEKYQMAAKDAMMQSDIVLAQTCMQYADHYIRLQNQAIQNEQQMRGNNNQQQSSTAVSAVKEEALVEEKDSIPVIEVPVTEDAVEMEIGEVSEDKKAEAEPEVVVEKPKRKPRAKAQPKEKQVVTE